MLCIYNFFELPTQCECQRRRDSISNLPVLVLNVTRKLVTIRETLRTCTLTNCNYPVLIRVKTHAHLTHRLRVCDGSWKVPFPVQPSKKPLPLIMPFGRVW
eukprot:TRINITY_DN14234_c0_g1_i1.p1 TRINITY_DN14234_c0_g1~~TRINITY_DN14234_c0_g1_i1.p1  ORF type:complete len:101 (+),score=9.13 TRINITY_DN14234_c0_g1_i1:475-777(+)